MKTVAGRDFSLPAIVLLALLPLFAAGCNESATPQTPMAPGKPLVALLLYKESDMYLSIVSRAVQNALADKVDILVQSAGDDQFVQNEQIDTLIALKAGILLVNPVEPMEASQIVDKAKKARIPVVFFNREPDLNTIRSFDRTCFVGTTPHEAGTLQGDIISRLWKEHPEYDRNKDGTCQYVMIQANAFNPEAIARTEYSVRRAGELGVPMRQVGETLMCNWDEELAFQAMRLTLSTIEDKVELVIANNDAMALGAIKALGEFGWNQGKAGRSAFIPVVGVDAIPQALDAIRAGMMSATVKQDGELMGRAIAAITLNALNGKPFLEGTPWQWDSTGIAVRIPHAPLEGKK